MQFADKRTARMIEESVIKMPRWDVQKNINVTDGIYDLVENIDNFKGQANAHGPRAGSTAYSQGGFYNGNGRVTKAGLGTGMLCDDPKRKIFIFVKNYFNIILFKK